MPIDVGRGAKLLDSEIELRSQRADLDHNRDLVGRPLALFVVINVINP